ncbi:Alpha-N-acetylglucosaminidase [Penicillium ucsense]|uniref:Alpha-N-acetylglucosaminidase n=1 Tax=Penicillium ucsense TaxID=2839758 RepID=A0A8J8W0Y1_9EURO|nr:Alpha-N-acetylglucosaminidase [Penicillium ucsense]KAF7735007.1 Alpha-N-acetylglucosaminidase [Penicillium ucsense]
MHLGTILLSVCSIGVLAYAQSTQGLYNLVKRRLSNHANHFDFTIDKSCCAGIDGYDRFMVSNGPNNTISIKGTSISALSSGLRRYLTDIAHVDIYWFIGSRLEQAPAILPSLNQPIQGSSTVRWRYHFNTVTFSYTTAFWSWKDWETQLDWMALHGVNLPLAWVGQEKILVEVFQELGLTDAEIASYLSGPAFQAWNRFGNIQGSWGGDLPRTWIDQQFALQMKILPRMVELGMTPVLPAFTGFVPMNTTRALPDAQIVRGSQWAGFPPQYSNDSYLEPFDANFAKIQSSFIIKQRAAYGSISNIYTLDQYNENSPYSGDLDYLRNVTYYTWQSLKQADPGAVWMMQGWLFYAQASFWTEERIQAFLSGIEKNDDMLILDLFSESAPQWRRTNSYYGKPWIWCQVHDYGGNMGLYGQLRNVTVNATEARAESPSLVGYGLTMEGQEGNEIMYTTLLDQAWSEAPLDTKKYFHNWVRSRYSGCGTLPVELYEAWDLLRTSVYDNTNTSVTSVIKSAFEIRPGLNNVRIGFQASVPTYNTSQVVQSWEKLYKAAKEEPRLWASPPYQHDMVDLTRQVIVNAFIPIYHTLISTWNTSSAVADSHALTRESDKLLQLLTDLDAVLLTNRNFRLSTWIESARSWAHSDEDFEAFLEYNARNQITLWGPDGEIADYASKQWGGLVSTYYVPRWRIFCKYLQSVSPASYNSTEVERLLIKFEKKWQTETWNDTMESRGKTKSLQAIIDDVQARWPTVFGRC